MEQIKILGVPFDSGQEKRGVKYAADYLRIHGLVESMRKISVVQDLGNIVFPDKKAVYLKERIKNIHEASENNLKISRTIEALDLKDDFLLNIGGDHGMSLGTIHGILSHRPDSIVIWADAHGDINTPETSPTGNFHGMPLTFLTGLATHPEFDWITHKLQPNKLILVGPRDLDEGERDLIEKYKIQYFSSEELNHLGAKEVLEMALHRADPHGLAPIHLSFDVDIFDGEDISSTGTIVPDGPKLEEVFLLGGLIAETGRMKSMDVVEFNPLIGTVDQVEASGELVMDFLVTTMRQKNNREFIYRAFDKTILSSEYA